MDDAVSMRFERPVTALELPFKHRADKMRGTMVQSQCCLTQLRAFDTSRQSIWFPRTEFSLGLTLTNIAPSSELHSRLRQATKAPHHLLDHHPVLAPLIKSGLTVTQYGLALAALHGVYAQAEGWVLEFLAEHPDLFDYQSRRKLPALESDLKALGRLPLACNMQLSAEPTLGALVGILYALEGSTLGGQFIARNLRLIPGASLPIRFFSGYGDQSRQRWEEFLQFADSQCPLAEYEEAVSTAVSIFNVIRKHLDSAYNPDRIN